MIKSKKRLKSDVIKQLNKNTRIDASDIQVNIGEDWGIILSGTVPYLSHKRAVTDIVFKVLGVIELENNLDVEFPEGSSVFADEDLQAHIQQALDKQSTLEASEVTVSVEDGVVTLGGQVDCYWKKACAESLASQILGVKEVLNKISVEPVDSRSDEEIVQDIKSLLKRDISADVDQVNILVNNGVVTLKGLVSSWIAKRAVENAAGSTSGVRDLVNNLSIRY